MRFSPYEPLGVEAAGNAGASNEAFFEDVARHARKAALDGAILLVGARDPRSLALRRAQAALRFDRLDSYWSHAALLVRWAVPALRSKGVEVSLDPERVIEQVPERNAVTAFELSRYADADRYPNVALLCLSFTESAGAAARRSTLLEAAVQPNRDRERYAFWDTLAAWARYAYSPHASPNPLLEGVPMPSAALCESAYEAAGVNLTPGATGNHCCPELLYATGLHWSEGLKRTEGIEARIFSLIRDETGAPQPSLSTSLDGLLTEATPRPVEKAKRRRSSRRT
ncbi:MAG TPA: hypothetical protein VK524_32390 [Polyangiaceae bacterium]|nr:hypothetical protein [Polyangiaceae bacterium]